MFLIHLTFCLLYYPMKYILNIIRCNTSFPFHMKTSDWEDKKDYDKRLKSPNYGDCESLSVYFSAQTTSIRELCLELSQLFNSNFKELYPLTVNYCII